MRMNLDLFILIKRGVGTPQLTLTNQALELLRRRGSRQAPRFSTAVYILDLCWSRESVAVFSQCLGQNCELPYPKFAAGSRLGPGAMGMFEIVTCRKGELNGRSCSARLGILA